ncbi:MAG TPA: NYN domain-containing protein [Candidatus Anaerotruncus excrementipullorum]|uniref:NYN domain-containing protein n=1 Tax=Candidatus Anaerotruncus excrementipullorum TaxID=2838465 RepID=A0A9D1WQ05_9FIRM|nr:NYN domain-containing protein [Candidatus Anaerotruncus excrementipullorum]
MPNDNKFAVLIDAENISDKYIKIILDEISNDGVATYKRIYGDWTNPALASWKKVLLDNSIIPIQQYSYTAGKNASDSAMIIDAMDILYTGQVDGFCLVSSDSDFTRLAARLREGGMLVVGMGERKTPKSFISACNRFKYLDILATSEAPQKASKQEKPEPAEQPRPARQKPQKQEKPEPPRQEPQKQPDPPREESGKEEPSKGGDAIGLATIKKALKAIARENSDEDGWVFIGTIGNLLVKRYPDFDVRNFGFSKLTPFLESVGLFDIKSVRAPDNAGKLIYVKLR